MNAEEELLLTRQAILRTLSCCGSYMLPEPVFLTQLNVSLFPPLTLKEFQTHLHWLESNELIVGIRPEIGGPIKWKLTDNGKALL